MLRKLPLASQQAALGAALPVCAPDERDHLIAELLSLHDQPGSQRALLSVLGMWPDLSVEARSAIVATLGSALPEWVARLRDSGAASDRRAAAYLAAGCLSRDAASADPKVLADFDAELASAAESFPEHRLQSVLDAVLCVAPMAGPRLRAWLADSSQAGHLPLRAAARSLPEAQRRRLTLSWLAVPALASLARERIERPSSEEDRRSLFERAHLLRARGRSTLVARLPQPERLLSADYERLTHAQRTGLFEWAALAPASDASRAALFGQALTDPETGVRFRAARALAALDPAPALDEPLADFAFDAQRPVAESAAAALCDASSPSRRRLVRPVVERLVRSPHPQVRQLARWSLASAAHPVPFTSTSSPIPSPAALRLWFARAPRACEEALAQALEHADPFVRVKALEAVARLGLAPVMQSSIASLARGDDERSASKAVAVLAHSGGGAADEPAPRIVREIVEEACVHHNGRVRASAVEAIARLAPADPRFASWSEDEVSRVRANALRHVAHTSHPSGQRSGHRESPVALVEMLSDARAAHRVSALWVVERLGLTDVASRVADLTRRDPEIVVRARATRCGKALLARMRQGWTAGLQRDLRAARADGPSFSFANGSVPGAPLAGAGAAA